MSPNTISPGIEQKDTFVTFLYGENTGDIFEKESFFRTKSRIHVSFVYRVFEQTTCLGLHGARVVPGVPHGLSYYTLVAQSLLPGYTPTVCVPCTWVKDEDPGVVCTY